MYNIHTLRELINAELIIAESIFAFLLEEIETLATDW